MRVKPRVHGRELGEKPRQPRRCRVLERLGERRPANRRRLSVLERHSDLAKGKHIRVREPSAKRDHAGDFEQRHERADRRGLACPRLATEEPRVVAGSDRCDPAGRNSASKCSRQRRPCKGH
eukprot:Amastigsp_a850101_9.p3 type:complete len:122 gc:universal Amastigsp_a850101_9:385-20(-)